MTMQKTHSSGSVYLPFSKAPPKRFQSHYSKVQIASAQQELITGSSSKIRSFNSEANESLGGIMRSQLPRMYTHIEPNANELTCFLAQQLKREERVLNPSAI